MRASNTVLLTVYEALMCSLINYASQALMTIFHSRKSYLETIQNDALAENCL